MTDHDQAFRYLTGTLTGGDRPEAVGAKFATDGAPRINPGNTTICHVDPRSDAHAALVAVQEALRAGPHASAFTFLPPSSLHMTIFEGVIEGKRDRARWPKDLPLDLPMPEVTAALGPRLRGLGLAQRFRARPVGVFAGFSISMTGADAAAEDLLRRTRDQLAAASGIARADHGSYRFHITLAYLMRWLSPDAAADVIDLSTGLGEDLAQSLPVIPFGPVEFCQFETMHHFETLHKID